MLFWSPRQMKTEQRGHPLFPSRNSREKHNTEQELRNSKEQLKKRITLFLIPGKNLE